MCFGIGSVMTDTVSYTGEFQRIASLPRRVWSTNDLAYLASALTEILRRPSGRMKLRPAQALGLHDAGVERGLFGALGVGEGKTLLSFLLPLVMNAQRPLLLLPAALIENAQRERYKLSQHWQIATSLRIFSLNMLGLVQAERELENYSPDLIIVDEAHRLKNKRAAVTRRIARYMHDRPYTMFAALSGSFIDHSIKEFAHILLWCLKLKAPIPINNDEIDEWAEVLDHDGRPTFVQERRSPGALLSLCTPEERAQYPEQIAARHGFRRRLTETPGVVATVGEGEDVGCSIYVRAIRHAVKPITEENFLKLRGDSTDENSGWILPDDHELTRAADVWRHAQELALGLHYQWDPRPPDDWLYARTEWKRFVRDTISRSRTFDSELHVANACDAGRLDGAKLERWREVRDTFKANVVPIWHDESAILACADWMKKPGIVWTEHRFFAWALSKYTGLPYFGEEGYSAEGVYIEDCKPGIACVASIDANREGKNLQHLWSRNLIVCPPKSGAWLEQLIARTHRPGQTADEVIVDILLGCRENFDAIQNAVAASQAVQELSGKKQKLLMATRTLPTEEEIDMLKSPRWIRR